MVSLSVDIVQKSGPLEVLFPSQESKIYKSHTILIESCAGNADKLSVTSSLLANLPEMVSPLKTYVELSSHSAPIAALKSSL